MVFSSNPLSLSVPEAAFESWLRDSGYIEVLDQRTSTATTTTSSFSGGDGASITTATATATSFFFSLFSRILTFLSLFTINPFSKLTTDDFSGQTPSWTAAFVGSFNSYSFPSSSSQACLRVHENVKRYARNYASLFILFFACTLYVLLFFLNNFFACYENRVLFGSLEKDRENKL